MAMMDEKGFMGYEFEWIPKDSIKPGFSLQKYTAGRIFAAL
jgi:hypothetical protein